nr:oxidized purine nucleoside triphosphate hydrolase-like [Cherax quadricarinatus]
MSELTKKLFTLAFIREGNRLLLGYKKRGFGQGRWNAFGGKVEAGETPEEAAVRGMTVPLMEMKPQWFSVDSLPYSLMWPDDELWYPIYLRGGKFRGRFHFQGHDKILSEKLEEVQTFD